METSVNFCRITGSPLVCCFCRQKRGDLGVLSDVVYLKRQEGGSVQISCLSQDRSTSSIGFYLRKKCQNPEKEVLFLRSGARDRTVSPSFRDRLQLEGEPRENELNVTISLLQHGDTGLYHCEFIYEGSPLDRHVSGERDFFVFVERAEPVCSCSSYPPLLYAISGGMALLLLIVAVLFGAHYGKQCCRSKPRAPVPIYEEMSGAKSPRRRAPCSFPDSSLLQETDTSVYVNPHARPPPHENYYVSPSHVPADSKD
ncbi:cd7 antigen-like isoform X4 [Lepisosteus oculatus]|uniref:cd7 antigen-like isoform X4 n=1 Tax=Lepisosteus oculatus TaxID=7918 RepID=UPI003720589F